VAEFVGSSQQLLLSVRRSRVEMACTGENLPLSESVAAVQWRRISEEGVQGLPKDVELTGDASQDLVVPSFSSLYHTGNYSCEISTSSGRSYTSNSLQLRSSESAESRHSNKKQQKYNYFQCL